MSETEIDRARRRALRLYPHANHFRTAYMQGLRAAMAGNDECPYGDRSGWAAWEKAWRRGYDSLPSQHLT